MMASVVAERYGVPSDRVAQASIARYTGALVSMMFGGYSMRRWFRVMIPLQLACAIASQFTSTLLFSNIEPVTLVGFPVERNISYQFKNNSAFSTQSSYASEWTSYQPLAFENFAEYAELADGVDDTGPVWRAFIPIQDETLRTSIHEYSGIARVFDARTICVRPRIQELFYIRSAAHGENDSEGLWEGRATVNMSQIPDIFDPQNAVSEIRFACNARPMDASRPLSQWAQCRAIDDYMVDGSTYSNHTPVRMGTLDPLYYDPSAIDRLDAEEERWLEDNPPEWESDPQHSWIRHRTQRARTGDGYMLVDLGSEYAALLYSGVYSQPSSLSNHTNSTYSNALKLPLLSSTENGPWSEFQAEIEMPIPNIEVILSMRATYCVDVMM